MLETLNYWLSLLDQEDVESLRDELVEEILKLEPSWEDEHLDIDRETAIALAEMEI
jgi:hypothetical protein